MGKGQTKSIELLQREQAFRLYKKYRDLKKVASYPGMPDIAILKVWKNEDDWDSRIEEIEEKLEIWNTLLKKIEDDSVLRDDVFHLMLLNKLLETTIKAIIERGLEPSSWKEAVETIKLIFEQKRLLLGRPQMKAEVDLTGLSEEELRKNLKDIYNLLSSKVETTKAIKEEVISAIEFKEESNFLDNNINEKELLEKQVKKDNKKVSFLSDLDE